LGDLIDLEQDPADDIPVIQQQPISRPGNLWSLGKHRLIFGDARDARTISRLMGRETAAMLVTDPPYNVQIASVQAAEKSNTGSFQLHRVS
jgi:DNA modification methylase